MKPCAKKPRPSIVGVKRDIEALRQETKTSIAGVQRDIEALRLGTKADIEALRLGTKADMAEVKSDLLKWMMGALDCPGWGGCGSAQIATGLRLTEARFCDCLHAAMGITRPKRG